MHPSCWLCTQAQHLSESSNWKSLAPGTGGRGNQEESSAKDVRALTNNVSGQRRTFMSPLLSWTSSFLFSEEGDTGTRQPTRGMEGSSCRRPRSIQGFLSLGQQFNSDRVYPLRPGRQTVSICQTWDNTIAPSGCGGQNASRSLVV